MPKGDEYRDNQYIPIPKNYRELGAYLDAFGTSAEAAARERLERTQAMLEPLRKDWLEADIAYLKAWNIRPF